MSIFMIVRDGFDPALYLYLANNRGVATAKGDPDVKAAGVNR